MENCDNDDYYYWTTKMMKTTAFHNMNLNRCGKSASATLFHMNLNRYTP